jgi:hypothetical protein
MEVPTMTDYTERLVQRALQDPGLLRKLAEAADLEGQCAPVRGGGPLPPDAWTAANDRLSVLCADLARSAGADGDPDELARWLTCNSRAVLREFKRRRSGRRLKVGRFCVEYVAPDGWSVCHQSQGASQASVLLRPPTTGWLRRPRLDLLVFPYPAGEPSEESFRRATLVNLQQRGAWVEEESMKTRHGARSHECRFCVGGIGGGYVVRVITLGHEVVVHWQVFGGQQTYATHLPQVEEFIDGLRLALEPHGG